MPEIEKKYPHYHQPCPYEVIDPYRIAEIYGLADPILFHAFKKILLCGQRGYKDQTQDIEESIDSLNRRLEMWEEDERLTTCGQIEPESEENSHLKIDVDIKEGQVLQGVMCPKCNSIVYGDLEDNQWCSKCDWDSSSLLVPSEYVKCERCED